MENLKSPLLHPTKVGHCMEQEYIFIDARSGPEAYNRYQAQHLLGSFHVDLDKDLSQKPTDPTHGGRHPLPTLKNFATLLGELGITPSTHVVVYDDKSGANAAARFWWMLRSIGHENILVVDGGLDAMLREGLPFTTLISKPIASTAYPVTTWKLPTVTLEEVAQAAQHTDYLVIDVREAYRYRGEREPIDLVAGHIPGAINIPYVNNLSSEGMFLPADALAALYKGVIATRESSKIIVQCGSGVTACHTLLALEQAGINGANLYVGSWGEWSRRDCAIATV